MSQDMCKVRGRSGRVELRSFDQKVIAGPQRGCSRATATYRAAVATMVVTRQPLLCPMLPMRRLRLSHSRSLLAPQEPRAVQDATAGLEAQPRPSVAMPSTLRLHIRTVSGVVAQ